MAGGGGVATRPVAQATPSVPSVIGIVVCASAPAGAPSDVDTCMDAPYAIILTFSPCFGIYANKCCWAWQRASHLLCTSAFGHDQGRKGSEGKM